MWQGKLKAVTFSYDDGVTQDIKLIEILNKYGLKATFNLNSSCLGMKGCLDMFGKMVDHNKVNPYEVKRIYDGHEVAVHTLTHPNLTGLDKDTVIWQVEEDRKTLSSLVGYEVRGMAYPCGGVNNDERVADILKNDTKIEYSRTITSTHNFDLQDDLFRFNPSVYYGEVEKMFEMAKEFITMKPDKPQLFYIWGHSYEMDSKLISWEKFEEFCKLISGKDDIFYGTNTETLLG